MEILLLTFILAAVIGCLGTMLRTMFVGFSIVGWIVIAAVLLGHIPDLLTAWSAKVPQTTSMQTDMTCPSPPLDTPFWTQLSDLSFFAKDPCVH